MTILQTLITKTKLENDPKSKISPSNEIELEKDEKLLEANSISEEERKNRNLLGLKIKGSINRKVLEENYKIRMRNYEESKLETMSASKRRTSLQKKERLQKAYDYLKALVNKES